MKTPREYREKVKQTKTITLPSGLDVEILPVPTLVILGLTTKADAANVELDKYMTQNFTETLNEVIPSSVVYPVILPVRETGQEPTDDALFLDELTIGDLNYLFTEIVLLSGISEKEIESYQSFPGDRDRDSSGADG